MNCPLCSGSGHIDATECVVPDGVRAVLDRFRRGHLFTMAGDIDVVIAWDKVSCARQGCDHPASRVFVKVGGNAHGGISTSRYRRCACHDLAVYDRIEPFPEPTRPTASSEGPSHD